jgi:hypothetical protein
MHDVPRDALRLRCFGWHSVLSMPFFVGLAHRRCVCEAAYRACDQAHEYCASLCGLAGQGISLNARLCSSDDRLGKRIELVVPHFPAALRKLGNVPLTSHLFEPALGIARRLGLFEGLAFAAASLGPLNTPALPLSSAGPVGDGLFNGLSSLPGPALFSRCQELLTVLLP